MKKQINVSALSTRNFNMHFQMTKRAYQSSQSISSNKLALLRFPRYTSKWERIY